MANKQTSNNAPLWVKEFGRSYDVPVEVTSHPKLVDLSWHNDTSPSFGIDGKDTALRLWVAHVDPQMRDIAGGKRFMVVFDGNDETCPEFVETDDVNEAIAAWEKTAAEWQAQLLVEAL